MELEPIRDVVIVEKIEEEKKQEEDKQGSEIDV